MVKGGGPVQHLEPGTGDEGSRQQSVARLQLLCHHLHRSILYSEGPIPAPPHVTQHCESESRYAATQVSQSVCHRNIYTADWCLKKIILISLHFRCNCC